VASIKYIDNVSYVMKAVGAFTGKKVTRYSIMAHCGKTVSYCTAKFTSH
jgi:hypothetical protein